MAGVAELVARLEALEREVEDLRAQLAARSPDPEPERPGAGDAGPLSRRGLLTAAAGAAVGGVAAAVGTAAPAAAANGDPIIIGSVSNTSLLPTGLAANTSGYGIGCTDNGLNALPFGLGGAMFGHTRSVDFYAGVLGYAEGADGEVGVAGISQTGRAVEAWNPTPQTEPALFALAGDTFGAAHGTALEGQGLIGLRTWSGENGTGVLAVTGGNDIRPARNARTAVDAQGRGTDSVGVRAMGGRAPLLLAPQGSAPRTRSDAHVVGELVEDSGGSLWLCTTAGSPGTWRKLAGPATAGALHVLGTPVRAYDSRAGQAPLGVVKGALGAGATRALDMSVGGAVPAGATAVLVNLTVVNTSPGGFLSAYRTGAAAPSTSSINWDHAGAVLGNNATVGVNTARSLTVRCGSGSTHLVVDVLGYYL
jgi:hypothetical protein